MHILIIPSWYPATSKDIGGSFFREQAIALSRYGCSVGVICPAFRSLRNWKSIFHGKYGLEYLLDEGIHTYRYHSMSWFPKSPYMDAKLWVSCGLKLFAKYIKEHDRPEVIHVHSMLNAGILAQKIWEKYGIPYVLMEHNSAFVHGMFKPWQISLCKDIVENASRRFAVSEAFAAYLPKLLHLEKVDWDYLPNAVNIRFEKSLFLKKEKNSGEFVFVSIALLSSKKGFDLLLKAFSLAHKEKPSLKLVIGGDGPERKKLEDLAENFGITKAITFKGLLSREEVLETMQQSNAYVLSSHFETFGVVLIESLALGRPIIATCCGGPESIVTPSNGLLVPTNDVEALAQAMLDMYEKYDTFDQYFIRKSCLECFGEKKIALSLVEIYDEILKNKS